MTEANNRAKYGFGPGAVIEPFPYSTAGSSFDASSPRTEETRFPRSSSEVPYIRQQPVYEKGRRVNNSGGSDREPVHGEESNYLSSRRDSGSQLESSNASLGTGLLPSSRRGRTGTRQRDESGSESVQLATMMSRELRSEVEGLRRDLERIRQGVVETGSEVPPPSYNDH